MLQHKKILVLLLIATVLASIPLYLAKDKPEITVVVNEIEIRTDYGKPAGTPGAKPDKPDKPDRPSGDYKLTGYIWNENLPSVGLTLFVGAGVDLQVIFDSAEEWDGYTLKNLIFTVSEDETATIFDELSDGSDGRNELVFADAENFNPGVIAVCYTWYIGKEIVQFDIAFNLYYTWGDADVDGSGVMDLQNIATHELGHGFGLADLYQRKLSDLTMYGYAALGETIKRDLAQGDIAGIQALYGVAP